MGECYNTQCIRRKGKFMKNKNLMKRIMAFIIDYSVVMLLVILVTNTKYLNPTYDEALEKSNNLSSLNNSYVLTTNMFDYYYKDKVITEEEYNTLIKDNDYFGYLIVDAYSDKEISEDEYDYIIKEAKGVYDDKSKDIYYEAIKANWYTYLVYTVVFFGYFVIFNMVTKGVSLGKRMTGLKIVSTNEKNIGLFRYLFRSLVVYGYFVYPLEILLPLVVPREYLASICSYLSLGVNVLQMAVMVSVLYNQDGRGLHDYLVKTKVVPLNDDVMDGVVLETKDINNSQEKDIDEVDNKDDDSIEKEKNENKNKDQQKKGFKMIKKVRKSLILVFGLILLCGCSTISTNMQIRKDKSATLTYLITLDKDYLGNKTFNELFSSKNINYLRNNGYTVTDYEDDDNFGYKVSANIKDIDTVSQGDNIKINLYDLLYSDIQNELYIFSREENWLKNKYTADFYVNLTDALTNNKSILGSLVNPPAVSYTFKLELPEKALSNNATQVSEDGKTLTWTFSNIMRGTNNINFSFELYNKEMLYIIYGVIGVVILIILSMIVRFFSWISDKLQKVQRSFFERAQKKVEKNSQIDVYEFFTY